MDTRFLTYAERGELFARLSSWPGVEGLDRLTLMQILGAPRLMAAGDYLTVDVTLDEIGRMMGRGLSTVRASVSKLREMALIARSGDHKTIIDVSAIARILGFVPGHPAAQPSHVGAVAHRSLGGCDRQDLGGTAPTSDSDIYISNSKSYNDKINYSDSVTSPADQLKLERLLGLVTLFRSDDVIRRAPRGQEIRSLLDLISDRIGAKAWTADAIREATEHAIPLLFRACGAGQGISLATARAAGEVFGATLLAHTMYALARGEQPKALLVYLMRNRRAPANYSAKFLEKVADTAMSKAEGQQARQVLADNATAQQLALDVVRDLKSAALNIEALSTPEGEMVAQGPRGYAEIRERDGQATLVLGLPNKSEYVLWNDLVSRNLSKLTGLNVNAVRVVHGGLAGGRQVKIEEAWAH